MALSSDLISQFVQITKEDKQSKETTVYGTIVEYNGSKYVRLDGSELLTPISTTADAIDGERVTVMIKNHNAIVTGNISSPAARNDTVKELGTKISEFEIIIADKVSVDRLEAEIARIDTLVSENVTIKGRLDANEADIDNLTAENVEITGRLDAAKASIDELYSKKIDADIVESTYATIENLEATQADIVSLRSTYGDFVDLTTDNFKAANARIDDLETKKLDAESAEIIYANIDFSNIGKAAIENFYATSGIIKDLVIGDTTITGELVGVTIKGDLIEGGTIVADKLVVKGNDGLYYKLNTDGVSVEAEQTEYNSLNGSVITAKSITATKISVDDLVAFDATIGGFEITENSLYSGVKSSAGNTTRGIYLDKDGQLSVGDSSNFLKYYKDPDGTYKLEISAGSIKMSASNKTIEEVIDDAIDDVEIGGRNLFIGTKGFSGEKWLSLDNWSDDGDYEGFVIKKSIDIGNGLTQTIDGLNGDQYVLSSWVKTTDSGFCMFYCTDNDGNTVIEQSSIECGEFSDWTRISKTFTLIQDCSFRAYFENNISGGTLSVCGLKLEKGNRPTDWSPSPEDLLDECSTMSDQARQEAVAESKSETDRMLIDLGIGDSNLIDDTEYAGSSLYEIVTSVINRTTSLEQDSENFNFNFISLEETIKNLGDDVSTEFAERLKYIRFADGSIILGDSESLFQVVITNTRISFNYNGITLSYLDNERLNVEKATIVDVTIDDNLWIGGFRWFERPNGNLALKWEG